MGKTTLNNFARGVKGVMVEERVLSSDESRNAFSTFEDLQIIEKEISDDKLLREAEARGIKVVTPKKRKLK